MTQRAFRMGRSVFGPGSAWGRGPGTQARVAAQAHTPARMSVRIRTRLYAAFVKVKIHPTFSRPR